METGLTATSSRHERLEKHLLMAALRVMEHEIGRLEFRGRQRTHNMDTQQPYLHWFLCLSCQVTLTLCPPKDIRRRPLALANCWLCLPWSHTSALPSAAGASLGQTGAWLWWAMRKVIFFCLGEFRTIGALSLSKPSLQCLISGHCFRTRMGLM